MPRKIPALYFLCYPFTGRMDGQSSRGRFGPKTSTTQTFSTKSDTRLMLDEKEGTTEECRLQTLRQNSSSSSKSRQTFFTDNKVNM